MKHCRKMKKRHRGHLGSMGRKNDIAWRHCDVDRRRRKKTHAINSAPTN
jgi:hypothetical protein